MPTSQRLLSLDIFRGMTIALMILVNNPGDWGNVYAPLLHADWHGCTPTDLVFPFFLFIVGVAITFALSRRKNSGQSQSDIYQKIIRRTILIFAIGLFLNGFPYFNLGELRIPGVLQRIALVYGVSAFLFLKLDWKGLLGTSVGLLLLYWGLMTLVPVPGHGAPNLDAETNLGAWLDYKLMAGHLWSQSKVWDPEGLLSTLPAIVTGLSGVLCGMWLRVKRHPFQTFMGIIRVGALLIVIGLLWDLLFPINKKIWTSSYVVYTSGLALIVLGVIYYLVDVKSYRGWAKPFVIYGTNALAVYVLSGIIARLLYIIKWTNAAGESISLKQWIYNTFFTPVLSPYNASFAFALANVLLLFGVAWILYRKKIFIKV